MTRMLARWEPFRDLASFQDRIDRLFEDTLGRGPGAFGTEAFEDPRWAPGVDILEKPNELVLRVICQASTPRTSKSTCRTTR